jgi:hypothetical protein
MGYMKFLFQFYFDTCNEYETVRALRTINCISVTDFCVLDAGLGFMPNMPEVSVKITPFSEKC